MKKTLIALMALAGVLGATESSPITLFDQWTFDSNLTSSGGRAFANQGATTSYANGVLTLGLDEHSDGLHLDDNNNLNLGKKNWALQITMQLDSTDSIANNGTLFCTANGSADEVSLQVNVNTTENSTTESFKFSNGDPIDSAIVKDTMVTYTLLNYNGKLYYAQDDTWCNVILSDNTERGYIDKAFELNKLMIGFTKGGVNGLNSNVLVDDIRVYTFNHEASKLSEVKAALVPEPTTATLSLLALAGLAARRRRR
ncbi:MAG: PEP-CTERM sorting domain-containing protein [Akkermansia sp.]|nr:PEP-CTERM sorting domain-containing protein [Akkermansia sp.]